MPTRVRSVLGAGGAHRRRAGHVRVFVVVVVVVLAAAGCKADIPSGVFGCDTHSDCPPGLSCEVDRCVRGGVGMDAAVPDAGRDAGADGGAIEDARVPVDAPPTDAGFDAGCLVETLVLPVSADTLLPTGVCGANHLGPYEYLNLGIGNGLFRFQLDDDSRQALLDQRVFAARLVLYRDPDCLASCPAADGSIRVRPMRSDWDEGSDGSTTFVPRAGADWCRRAGGTMAVGWGADGATAMGIDVGDYAGTGSFGTTEVSITIGLDPVDFDDWMDLATPPGFLSLQTTPVGGVFVAATRENDVEAPAVLELDACSMM